MTNVLYIGNALSNKGKSITSIEILGKQLNEICFVKTASSYNNKFLRLLDMCKLVLANKSKTDFVLIDTYSTTNFYYALIISQLCRVLKLKYIAILRGGNLENRLKNNSKLCYLVFKNAYKLVAPSNFLKLVFESYNYKNVLFIPNNIEIENYDFYNRRIDSIKLLWVRSFSSIYNPNQAVLVLEKLIERKFDVQLTMVGPEIDGSLRKVKDLAKSKQLQVKFTGKLSKLEWLALSKNFNIFINTTNFDNTPVSVIESMALGLPIISTNVGGLPFLITNNVDGLLVEPNNVNSMVDAIIKLSSDENLRNKLVVNARAKVENFDWKAVKPKWEALLS